MYLPEPEPVRANMSISMMKEFICCLIPSSVRQHCLRYQEKRQNGVHQLPRNGTVVAYIAGSYASTIAFLPQTCQERGRIQRACSLGPKTVPLGPSYFELLYALLARC